MAEKDETNVMSSKRAKKKTPGQSDPLDRERGRDTEDVTYGGRRTHATRTSSPRA